MRTRSAIHHYAGRGTAVDVDVYPPHRNRPPVPQWEKAHQIERLLGSRPKYWGSAVILCRSGLVDDTHRQTMPDQFAGERYADGTGADDRYIEFTTSHNNLRNAARAAGL